MLGVAVRRCIFDFGLCFFSHMAVDFDEGSPFVEVSAVYPVSDGECRFCGRRGAFDLLHLLLPLFGERSWVEGLVFEAVVCETEPYGVVFDLFGAKAAWFGDENSLRGLCL